ncbi:AAA family ATPase [Algoriphagus aquimarinus]|uniref:AAA family ATPase n=1 Tax=Algoriphagus aquimarinus TaxID=237018 RepID=UPI0030DABA65|tara:strand:- start:5470 stop:7740 length:2271 start_codon:yes stop_codon:yes gene_type:complete
MITKVNKIKDFGIFKDFTWSVSINPFKKRNLIYGWNYSGKTTLSKLFSNLDKKSKIHFPSSEYIFEVEKNTETYTQEQLGDFPYLVKVFNSFYAKNIFSWDKENNEGFEPILFYLGDEAGNIQPKIDSLSKRWNPKIEAIKKKNEAIVSVFFDYEKNSGKFSKQATEIRKYLNDQIKGSDFNKSHFILLVEEVKTDLTKHTLAADKVKEIKEQALATNDFSQQDEDFILSESLTSLGGKVKAVLEDSAPKSIPFPELDEDENLFNWVQAGLHLHKDSEKCKFCDNDLKQERIKSLNQYYSDKLHEIQDAIKRIREEFETDEKGLGFDFPHDSRIAKHLREKYKAAISDYGLQKKRYIKELVVLESELKKKESNYFNSISATTFNTVSVINELQKIIKVIKEHNLFVEKFEDKKQEALNLILHHYVAEYLTAENYLTKEKEKIITSDLVNRCIAKLKENKDKIIRLEALLKNTVKGQEELNIYLKIFLNREDIQIAIDNDMFVLRRGIHPATNLSEGEKTAIAFAYFLTELKSLKKEKKLKDTIIFFDDPISSLDSNHIFQVRSLIQHFFKDKDDYLQLFISTHNFEFFSVLLDSSLFKNENKADTKPEKCPYYLINRTTLDTSTITNLPKSLRSHKSEYAHIFAILKEYNELADKEIFQFKILLPNALRRFLELYTLFKYPKGFCEVDERIKMIFSPDDGVFHNTKLYHWFSHQNQFEKVAHHDGKIILIDEAISEVMKHIEVKDELHWKGLTETA